jgi:hypothetical protein
MYCEDSEATDIEHFFPKAVYPLKCFAWDNYLLACANCNSNYKRSLFPTSAAGLPMLINPFDSDPFDHLDLSPATGEFVAITPEGQQSITIFGLNRQTLVDGRRDTWTALKALIHHYDQLNRQSSVLEVQQIVQTIMRTSFSCVAWFIARTGSTNALMSLAPQTQEELNRNPELLAVMN